MNQKYKFHHVHTYVDSVQSADIYKSLEKSLNEFWSKNPNPRDHNESRKLFLELKPEFWSADPKNFVSYKQDLIVQLITAFSFRITGENISNGTHSYILNSKDPSGAKFVITAKDSNQNEVGKYNHFSASHLDRFFNQQANRQGFSVLCFEVPLGELDQLKSRYQEKHPKLVFGYFQYDGMNILEVFAYYQGEKKTSDEDRGTVLRFIELTHENVHVLPGFSKLQTDYAKITDDCLYSDHWVSNVTDRVSFIETLNETMGWTPKVDFNAGVVAAGEAQIESTVIGNTSTFTTTDSKLALVDQSQVYLPTNNALSHVGHVHLYLKEIGQGIQHLASRVNNIVEFIQRANDIREITGGGFTFLNIPRSYYGRMNQNELKKHISDEKCLKVCDALVEAGLMDLAGIVNVDITEEQIQSALKDLDLGDKLTNVIKYLKVCIYGNLHRLLGDYFDESTYLDIVKNKILVDIQGQDVLFQIFTSNVLQRNAGEEAPFLETIQRVCSTSLDKDGNRKPLRAGCGGFGIRNFLTLFLSIEVSKAMGDLKKSKEDKDEKKEKVAQKMVDTFTQQMDESNPILTEISDAMTAEADAIDDKNRAQNPDDIEKFQKEIVKYREIKENGSKRLQELSAKYNFIMKQIRMESQQ